MILERTYGINAQTTAICLLCADWSMDQHTISEHIKLGQEIWVHLNFGSSVGVCVYISIYLFKPKNCFGTENQDMTTPGIGIVTNFTFKATDIHHTVPGSSSILTL